MENKDHKGITEKNEAEMNKNSEKDNISGGKKVIINADAYKSIILYSTRYANSSIPRENWKEIYGILIGYIDKERNAVIQGDKDFGKRAFSNYKVIQKEYYESI